MSAHWLEPIIGGDVIVIPSYDSKTFPFFSSLSFFFF